MRYMEPGAWTAGVGSEECGSCMLLFLVHVAETLPLV
jgi:hypothetical protein